MNINLKQALGHIAQGVGEQSDALSTLSDQVAVIESQQHEVNTQTVRILALIAEVIHEQGIFANEFNNLCRVWNPKFHTGKPVPKAISRRLRQWHYLFSSRVRYLTQAATSLVETTNNYKEAARRATSHIQVCHRDRILQLNMQIAKIQIDCTLEAERLEAWRQRLLSARDGLTRQVSDFNGDIDQVKARIDSQKADKKGLGFSIAGTGLGVIGMGLGTLCPPLAAAAGVISITSSVAGLVLTNSKRSKGKEIEKEVDKILHKSQQISNEIDKMDRESKVFNEQSNEVKTVHGDVQKLLEDFSPLKAMAETLERASIQCCSVSSSLSLRVSGILSSSTALEMVMSYEHLMDCAEAILSDFSCSTQEDRQPFIEWEIPTPNHSANESHDGSFVILRNVTVSQDSKRLICTVAVKDLVIKEPVIGRLTFDDWQTQLELHATHHDKNEPMPQLSGFHLFKFDIDISGEAQCRAKDMLLRVRYTFEGENYWNTSDGKDFRVHFKADKLALNQVLADLQTGLDEIQLHGNTMESFRLLEDRDDYHEMMKPRLSDIIPSLTGFFGIVVFSIALFTSLALCRD